MLRDNKMKTIGIIGGFGPESTAQFYLSLVQTFRISAHGQQPSVIVKNAPVHSSLEHELLLHGSKLVAFIPLLTRSAIELERAGADIIVFPCNTLHVHADEIEKVINVPFISIIKSSVQALHKLHVGRVGILGTSITIRQNLFARIDKSIEFISVPQPLQTSLDAGIDLIVATQDSKPLRDALRRAFLFFSTKDVRDVLLACTDFHGLCPKKVPIRTHDTLKILVDETVRSALGNAPTDVL